MIEWLKRLLFAPPASKAGSDNPKRRELYRKLYAQLESRKKHQ